MKNYCLKTPYLCFLGIFIFISNNLNAQLDYTTALRKATILLEVANSEYELAANELKELKSARITIEEDLAAATFNPKNINKANVEALKVRLKEARKVEKVAADKRKDAETKKNYLQTLVDGTHKNREKYIIDYEKKYGTIGDKVTETVEPTEPQPVEPNRMAQLENGDAPVVVENIPSETPNAEKPKRNKPKMPSLPKMSKPKKENTTPTTTAVKTYAQYDPDKDVMKNPPAHNCKETQTYKDAMSEKMITETASFYVFGHTEDFMRPALGNKEFINCHISGSRSGSSNIVATLTFTISSSDVQRTFGFLDKDALISFKLINGLSLNFKNVRTDIGNIDNNAGATTYKAQIQFTKLDLKSLESSELDFLRIQWSTGYEDYQITNVDVIQNMLECIK